LSKISEIITGAGSLTGGCFWNNVIRIVLYAQS
jgi:hypothetical protein